MDDIEETIPLNLSAANNQMELFSNLNNSIQTIHRTSPSGSMDLLVATCEQVNETIQVFLTNNAFQSFGNVPYQLRSYDVWRMNALNRLFFNNWNLFHTQEELPDDDDDYIEWSVVGENLIRKRQEFREQIDLYKIYNNQHHSITRLLIEIIDYYIKQYLAEEERFSVNEIKNLEKYFHQAIKEKNYLKYFIKVYTMSNNFHRVLNKHLALYILDYFDIYSYSSSPKGYRLINCLVYIVTLLINHPDIHKYQYNGIVYRGLIMTENTL